MAVISFNRLGLSCLLALLLIGIGCTAGKNGPGSAIKSSNQSAELTASKSVAGGLGAVACAADDFALFENTDGDVVDLDRETLPRGLFLATLAEMAIEKKAEGSTPARLIVREVSGGKGAEITCADGIERLGPDFEMALTGLVKFETTLKPAGSGFTSRQFFFFQDKDGYGVVLSNPKHLISSLNRQQPVDLRQILRASPASPQLLRVSDRAYLLKYTRERDGVRGYLLIHLALY